MDGKYDKEKNWVFVSVVRAVDQIVFFDELLKKFGRKLEAICSFLFLKRNL
jgi:hypothetical protein